MGEPKKTEDCPKCWGVGKYPFNPHHTCTKCNGTGKIASQRDMQEVGG